MADMKCSARQKILDVAAELFYREGFHAVGIDTIIERAGVAKMTLYRHFSSKDDLIVAYLEQSNARFWFWFDEAVGKYPQSPYEQLLAIFDALTKIVTTPACCGCPFLNTSSEFPELEYAGHKVALEHKRAVRARLCELAERAGARQPAVLADQLLLLMDGAFVQARMFGTENPASHVSLAARALIDQQLLA